MGQWESNQLSIPDNDDDGNPSSEIKNPLLIDVVLNGVFEKLQVGDLKTCRAVCSLWNCAVLASSSWKRRIQVRATHVGVEDRTVEAFSKLMEAGNGTCLSEIFSIETYTTIPLLFLSHCGVWVKSLKLLDATFVSKKDFRTVVCKAFPNMEELICQSIKFGDDQVEELPSEFLESKFGEQKHMKSLKFTLGEGEEVLWMEILNHFPNLHRLYLQGVTNNSSLSGFSNLLIKFRQKFPAKLKLTHISLATDKDPYPEFLQILKDPGLELQSIISPTHCCEPNDLREVLSIHASSLKELFLSCRFNNRIIYPHEIFPLESTKFRYCRLDALEILKLGDQPFHSLAILKFTPNLRMLKLLLVDDTMIENTQTSEMEGVSLKKCNRLILDIHFVSCEALRKLSIWLPNVEELQLAWIANAHLQMICESWPRLVAFVAHYGSVDDMGITGLDEEDVRRINDHGESSPWRPITVPKANISSLKDLRSFYVCTSSDGNPIGELGYCAAVCGFELMPKLERFGFCRNKLKRGSIWERLQSRFPKADIHLRWKQDFSDFFWD